MEGTDESNEHVNCTKCFFPINPQDRVEIQGQSFHRGCAACCMCRTIPKSLIMISGNIFCEQCYKSISKRFGGNPVIKTNGWWLHWAPQFCHNHEHPKPTAGVDEEVTKNEAKTENCASSTKCLRCLQNIVDDNKIVINGKPFHTECARCCVCHVVPKSLQIYYGSVFCEECFQRHIMNRHKDNTAADFFKACFEQYERNLEFANNISRFMGSSGHKPTIFVVSPPQNNRCGQNIPETDRPEPKCEYTK